MLRTQQQGYNHNQCGKNHKSSSSDHQQCHQRMLLLQKTASTNSQKQRYEIIQIKAVYHDQNPNFDEHFIISKMGYFSALSSADTKAEILC